MKKCIERNVYVLTSKQQDNIDYTRGTDLVDILFKIKDYEIPDGVIAKVYVQKPSGKGAYGSATVQGNDVFVDVTTQMVAELGYNFLQVEILNENKNALVTFEQTILVHRNLFRGDEDESWNEGGFFNEVHEAIDKAEDAAEKAEQATEKILADAESGKFNGKDGENGRDGVDGKDGAPGRDGENGAPGEDGYSPTISLADVTDGVRITVHNKDGEETAEVRNGINGRDGIDGQNGTDGFSPSVHLTETETGVEISVQNKEGTETAFVKNGTGGDISEEALLKFAVKETAEGENVTILDSAEFKVQGMNIFGKSTQQTTTGAQLFDLSKVQTTLPKIEVNEESAEMTAQAWGVGLRSNGTSMIPSLKPSTKYYARATITMLENVSAEDVASATTHYKNKRLLLYRDSNTEEGGFSVTIVDNEKDMVNGESVTLTTYFTTPENLNNLKIMVYSEYVVTQDGRRLNAKIKVSNLMISETPITDTTSYEPYTGGKPSPSPQYPQPIASAGDKGNVVVSVSGTNIVDVTKQPQINPHLVNVSDDGYEVIYNNNNNNRYDAVRWTFNVEPDTDYVLQFDSIDKNMLVQVSGFIQGTSDVNLAISAANNYKKSTFNSKNDDELTLSVYSPELITGTVKGLTIYKGDSNTNSDWESYKIPQSLILSTPNGLRGIPVKSGGNYTDANGQRWVADSIEYRNGKVYHVQRIYKATIKSDSGFERLDRYYSASIIAESSIFRKTYQESSVGQGFMTQEDGKLVLSNMVIAGEAWSGSGEFVSIGSAGKAIDWSITRERLGITDDMDDSQRAEKLKEWLADSDKELIFYTALANAIETEITGEEAEALKALYTYDGTTVVENDEGCHLQTTYVADTKRYIEKRLAELNTTIAKTQAQII